MEQRIAALETGAKYDAAQAEVQAVETEFLLKLREIRAVLAMDGGGATSTTTTGINAELEALRAENEALKTKNSKLEYRVQHVVAELEKLYATNKDLNEDSLGEF